MSHLRMQYSSLPLSPQQGKQQANISILRTSLLGELSLALAGARFDITIIAVIAISAKGKPLLDVGLSCT